MDSLWDVAGSELRDWETMTAFLLQDRGEEQDKTKERPVCVFSGLSVTDISRQPSKPGFHIAQSDLHLSALCVVRSDV